MTKTSDAMAFLDLPQLGFSYFVYRQKLVLACLPAAILLILYLFISFLLLSLWGMFVVRVDADDVLDSRRAWMLGRSHCQHT